MRESFHLPDQFPNGSKDQGWARSKLGARNLNQILHEGTGAQELGLAPTALPGALARNSIKNAAACTQTAPI